MKNMDNKDFDWNELLYQIHMKNVIPVIGQGLYWVRIGSNRKVLLYQHLADQLAKKMGFPSLRPTNHAFSRAVFQYLKENPNDFLGLQHFLTEHIASLSPISRGPLWKLSRIKPFSLFINSTYDHCLVHTLNSVRKYPTEVLHHTYIEKRAGRVTNEQLERLEYSNGSLVFHIYGSTAINLSPAYTEKDILETLVTFQKDMEMDPKNSFFQALKEKSLLFVGCGYDDWLFRFFIRTIANEPYQTSSDLPTRRFIADNFDSFNSGELACFLNSYNSEVFFSSAGKSFVDILFDEIYKRHPRDIIQEDEFPVPDTALISFHGDNRQAARQLASNLKNDGINVWMDEFELKPGDPVAETIVKAVEKCPAFIPLISEEAKQFQENQSILKYHIREWEWAYSRHVNHQNPKVIVPVKIDNTDLRYETFKDIAFIKIPDGKREGDYEKLKERLLEIRQNNTREP